MNRLALWLSGAGLATLGLGTIAIYIAPAEGLSPIFALLVLWPLGALLGLGGLVVSCIGEGRKAIAWVALISLASVGTVHLPFAIVSP